MIRDSSRFLPLLALTVLLVAPLAGSADDKVTWNPSSVVRNAYIGTVSSLQVTFTSGVTLTNVQVQVVPEIAPYVSTVPSAFETIQGGVPQSITISFSIPKGASTQALQGTIQLRSAGKTLARPLPVTLNFTPLTASYIPLEISIPSSDRIVKEPDPADLQFVKDEIDIFFKSLAGADQIKAIVANLGGVFLGSVPELNFYQVEVGQEGFENVSTIIQQLQQNPNVDLAVHSILQNKASSPIDPCYPLSYGPKLINLPTVWDNITTGSDSFGVAVIDNTFNSHLADFVGNIKRFIPPSVLVLDNHGTRVASIVGARGNNGIGIAGVMWNAALGLYSASDPGGNIYLPAVFAG